MANVNIYGYTLEPWAMIALVAVGLLVFAGVISAVSRPRQKRYCPSCGTVAVPHSRYQGSDGIGIILLVIFFPAFLAYEIWRHAAPKWPCPTCGKGGMIPLSSPAARLARMATVTPQQPADGPGRYAIWGVEQATGNDVSFYIDADSRANAQVKAELQGVVVTAVEQT